ncbi:uncharacterized protein LOC143776496 [Ranitomeya variabilis]|uniref:uncharacterized protein LOC143776496 n=1 Tax=Ranitomeya variabilis TaxID=490064 RepID=UPI0040561FF4
MDPCTNRNEDPGFSGSVDKEKTRWRLMKDRFNKDLCEESRVPSASGARIRRYKYHQVLAFLRPVLAQRTTYSTTVGPGSGAVLHPTATDPSQPSSSAAAVDKEKTRWRLMKDRFNKDLCEESRVPSASGARIRRYKYHQVLAFLRPVLAQRTTYSTTVGPGSGAVLHPTATDPSQPSSSAAAVDKEKTRWRLMKDRFNKDLREESRVPNASGARIRRYKYHRVLAFLRPVLAQRTTYSTTVSPGSGAVLHPTATDPSQPSSSAAAGGPSTLTGDQGAGPSGLPLFTVLFHCPLFFGHIPAAAEGFGQDTHARVFALELGFTRSNQGFR